MGWLYTEANVCLPREGDSGLVEKKHQLFWEIRGRWAHLQACERKEIDGRLQNVILYFIFQRWQFHCKVDKSRGILLGQMVLFSHCSPASYWSWWELLLAPKHRKLQHPVLADSSVDELPFLRTGWRRHSKFRVDHLCCCWTSNGHSDL